MRVNYPGRSAMLLWEKGFLVQKSCYPFTISSVIDFPQNDDNPSLTNKNSFKIRITGPGIDTLIEISGEDDFIILDAILNKIKKSM